MPDQQSANGTTPSTNSVASKKTGSRADDGPNTETDLYISVVESDVPDRDHGQVNLGVGNYTDKEYWQQIRSFQDSMYADAAFARRLQQRAIDEAIHSLGKAAWDALDAEEKAQNDRRRFVKREGRERWDKMSTAEKQEFIDTHFEIGDDWYSPQKRMLWTRHEASRSRGARLIDNLFGRVKKQVQKLKEENKGAFRSLSGGDGR